MGNRGTIACRETIWTTEGGPGGKVDTGRICTKPGKGEYGPEGARTRAEREPRGMFQVWKGRTFCKELPRK